MLIKEDEEKRSETRALLPSAKAGCYFLVAERSRHLQADRGPLAVDALGSRNLAEVNPLPPVAMHEIHGAMAQSFRFGSHDRDVSPVGTRPLRIFVVEDHPDTLKGLCHYLEMTGHTGESAQTVAQALATFPNARCEVLISDLGLPDGDGWELLRRIYLSQPIYAIAMSGFNTPADRLKSKEAGFRVQLLKPFAPSELDAALGHAAKEIDAQT